MKTVWAERFHCSSNNVESREILLVFSSHHMIDRADIVATVEADLDERMAPDEVLIAVPDPYFGDLKDLVSNQELGAVLRARLKGRTTVSLSGYGLDAKEERYEHQEGPAPPARVSPLDLCRQGITQIFKNRGGFLRSTSIYHFVHPSGRHTDVFLEGIQFVG